MSSYWASMGTRTGDRHRRNGVPNQDYGCYARLPGSLGIIGAVADGAGSATEAAKGSKAAATQATLKAWKTATRMGWHPDPVICVHEAAMAARKAVVALAGTEGLPIGEFHTTLLVAMIYRGTIAVAHVGDGASIVGTDGHHKMLTIPARGQYANETFFITMDSYEDLIARNSAKDIKELMLFTDGVQNELIDFRSKRAHQDTTAELANIARGADFHPAATSRTAKVPDLRTECNTELNRWLDEGETTRGDDATILVLHEVGGNQ